MKVSSFPFYEKTNGAFLLLDRSFEPSFSTNRTGSITWRNPTKQNLYMDRFLTNLPSLSIKMAPSLRLGGCSVQMPCKKEHFCFTHTTMMDYHTRVLLQNKLYALKRDGDSLKTLKICGQVLDFGGGVLACLPKQSAIFSDAELVALVHHQPLHSLYSI